MKLIFIYGPPASGKLTVGRELSRLTGFALFHNHLVIDALLAVFEFGSEPFVELRERFWIDVMATAAASTVDGLIFTFAPEDSVREGFVERLTREVQAAGDEMVFVRLDCSDAEIERRLGDRSRQGTGKIRSVEQYRELEEAGVFDAPAMPLPALAIDSELLSATQAAKLISVHLAERATER